MAFGAVLEVCAKHANRHVTQEISRSLFLVGVTNCCYRQFCVQRTVRQKVRCFSALKSDEKLVYFHPPRGGCYSCLSHVQKLLILTLLFQIFYSIFHVLRMNSSSFVISNHATFVNSCCSPPPPPRPPALPHPCCQHQGPSVEKLSPLVHSAMPILVTLMQDPHVMVKDSATWTIGKICELHGQSIPAEALKPLVTALLAALDDSPRVCSKACFALHNFGDQFEDSRDNDSNLLSPYLSHLVQKLLLSTQRDDREFFGVLFLGVGGVRGTIQIEYYTVKLYGDFT